MALFRTFYNADRPRALHSLAILFACMCATVLPTQTALAEEFGLAAGTDAIQDTQLAETASSTVISDDGQEDTPEETAAGEAAQDGSASEEGASESASASSEQVAEPAVEQPQPEEADPRTVPPTDDANYALLGEYTGEIRVSEDGQPELFGLQVRPIGEDRFEALRYEGGLPGAGAANTAEPLQLIGRRSGELVVLSGGTFAYFVQPETCNVVSSAGELIGSLNRIDRSSPSLGAAPPEGAMVLFDGSGTEHFTKAQMTSDGLLMHGADLNPLFVDFDLHVEFWLPYMPSEDGQDRGNSGCYLQSRYEVQVLDSFAQLVQFNGCSSLYRQRAPDLNMCFPPLRWQTYDIRFTAPRWAADGSKMRNARLTVWHNGIKTHDDIEIVDKTGAGQPEQPFPLPIRFQDHSDPVRFRNIWIIDRGLPGHVEFPVMKTGAEG